MLICCLIVVMEKTEKNYLFEKMPVIQAILKLAIPSVIGQLILVIYNIADTFFIGYASNFDYFVSNGLTNALMSGVTICMPVFMIISAISNLFGIGAGSVISRSAGKRNFNRTKDAAGFAVYASLISLTIYCLLSFILLKPIALFLSGGDETIAQYAIKYMFITVVLGALPTGMSTLFSHLFRAEGRSFNASFGIALGGILNVLLDPLFMFVLFDIQDAAIAAAMATLVSNIIAMLYFVIYYFAIRHKTFINLGFKKTYFLNNVPKEILIIGLPACLMTLFENISYMILDFLIASNSSDVIVNQACLAGVGAAKKINMFAHSIARGMSQGVLPLIGYNKSSGQRIRMRKIVYTSTLITTSLAIVCCLINIFVATPLSSLFLHDELALQMASKYLIIFSIGAPFSAFSYCAISFFQAVGKAWRSLILALLRKGICDIPLMLIMAYVVNMSNGIGIIMATPIADGICCIVSTALFSHYLYNHGRVDKVRKEHFYEQAN